METPKEDGGQSTDLRKEAGATTHGIAIVIGTEAEIVMSTTREIGEEVEDEAETEDEIGIVARDRADIVNTIGVMTRHQNATEADNIADMTSKIAGQHRATQRVESPTSHAKTEARRGSTRLTQPRAGGLTSAKVDRSAPTSANRALCSVSTMQRHVREAAQSVHSRPRSSDQITTYMRCTAPQTKSMTVHRPTPTWSGVRTVRARHASTLRALAASTTAGRRLQKWNSMSSYERCIRTRNRSGIGTFRADHRSVENSTPTGWKRVET